MEEILGAWYPSHKAFLALKDQGQISEDNFRLRNLVVEYAVVHRCPEGGIPTRESVEGQKSNLSGKSNLSAYANSSGYVY